MNRLKTTQSCGLRVFICYFQQRNVKQRVKYVSFGRLLVFKEFGWNSCIENNNSFTKFSNKLPKRKKKIHKKQYKHPKFGKKGVSEGKFFNQTYNAVNQFFCLVFNGLCMYPYINKVEISRFPDSWQRFIYSKFKFITAMENLHYKL